MAGVKSRWAVVVGLVLGVVWAVVTTVALADHSVQHYELPPVDGVRQHRTKIWWNLVSWAVAAGIGGLGLLVALGFALKGRLRRKSWMPVVCLAMVVAMATIAWLSWEPRTF